MKKFVILNKGVKMDRRERRNEERKMEIVKNYFKGWKWWLLSVVMSVALSTIYIFTQSQSYLELNGMLRFSIATCWAFTVMTLALISYPKAGGLLLGVSSLFFIIGSLSGFKEPTLFLAVTTAVWSIGYLLIQILVGIQFKFDIKVKELPWCHTKESNVRRNIKKGRKRK